MHSLFRWCKHKLIQNDAKYMLYFVVKNATVTEDSSSGMEYVIDDKIVDIKNNF